MVGELSGSEAQGGGIDPAAGIRLHNPKALEIIDTETLLTAP